MVRIFLNFYLAILLIFCTAGCKKEQENKENNSTLENNATAILKPKEKQEESQETPLQKELKKNLKSHLNELSKELQEKNLNHLQIEQNAGMQKHIEHFESLHGRKDIPKNSGAKGSDLNQKIQEAYILQQERIDKLQQKNDELGK